MKDTTIKKAANDLMTVATRLAHKRHECSDDLYRIAQNLIDANGGGTNVTGLPDIDPALASSFDPSSDVSMNVMPMAAHHGDAHGDSGGDSGSDSGGGGGNHMHPGIDSYVKDDPQAGMVDDRKTHTLQCTLKAPEGISESDMMNYILGIGKALNVDVDSFRWSKSEPKPVQGGGPR